VLVAEGLKCERIMEGNTEDGIEVAVDVEVGIAEKEGGDRTSRQASSSREKSSRPSSQGSGTEAGSKAETVTGAGRRSLSPWPAWYTWPLISRISFTLGNLTTTNANNR
jgi:hypothetical protein